jgi:hypothetical protein
VDSTQTPIREHLEFDRMCSTLEEFEYLPEASVEGLKAEPQDRDDEGQMDQFILAGLVTPA